MTWAVLASAAAGRLDEVSAAWDGVDVDGRQGGAGRRSLRGQGGASAAEFISVTGVVAVLIGAMVLTPIGSAVSSVVASGFCAISGSRCESEGAGGGPGGGGPTAADATPTGGTTGPDDGGGPATDGRDPETGDVTDPDLTEGIPPGGSPLDPEDATGTGGEGSSDPATATPGPTTGGGEHGEQPTGTQSDPVDSLTGAFVTQATDLAYPGLGFPLRVQRSYNSARAGGDLGPGWHHPGETRIEAGADRAVFISEDGARFAYQREGDDWVGVPGVRSTLERTGDGWELTRTDLVVYRFDAGGRLVEIELRDGTVTAFDRDAEGRLRTVTDGSGQQLRYTYDEDLLTAVTGPDDATVRFAYEDGRLRTVTRPGGATWTYEHDGAGRITEVVDPSDRLVVENVYGEDGRVVRQIDGAGEESRFTWDPDQGVATMFDNAGSAWTDVYRRGLLVRRIDPHGRFLTYTYDDDLNVTSVTNELGRELGVRYDEAGRPLAVTAFGGDVVQRFTYGDGGEVTERIDPAGRRTAFDHDAAGRVVEIVAADGGVTTIEIDRRTGQPSAVVDPSGERTEYAWEERGLITGVTDAAGGEATFEHDAAGRVVAVTDELGATSTMSYDAAGRLVAVEDALGNVTRTAYDAAGRVVAVTDALDRTTRYRYDDRGDLVEVEAADGAVTRYEYDATRQLVARTTPTGGTYRYAYDAAGRLVSTRMPTGEEFGFHWDVAGNLVRTDVPSEDGSVSIERTYDEANRLVRLEAPDREPVTYEYDATGLPTVVRDGLGEEAYTYDELGRLIALEREGEELGWQYDGAGRTVARTLPNGDTYRYEHRGDGQIASIATPDGTFAFERDAAGRLLTARNPNGTVERRTYDPLGRTLSQQVTGPDTTVLERSYTYDEVGNLLAVEGDDAHRFAYDERHQLVEECHDDACTAYAYDAAGNRTERDGPEGTTRYRYDAADRLERLDGPAGEVDFEHDAAGRMTRAGDASYTYDAFGNQTSATTPAGTTEYTLDGFGRRRHADGPDGRTSYTWDPTHSWPQIVAVDGPDGTQHPVWGPEGLLAVRGDEVATTHVDRLRSVVAVTDPAGELVGTREYSAFGETLAASGAEDLTFGFTGELTDPETGLVHLRAREYDPSLGRFLQRDPAQPVIDDPFTASYLYTQNRPTVFTDPLGLWCVLGKNPDGSCRGSGVVDAVSDTVEDAGDWVVEHREGIIDAVKVTTIVVGAGVCIAASFGTCAVAVGAGFAVRSGATLLEQDKTTGEKAREIAIDGALSWLGLGLGGATSAAATGTDLGRGTTMALNAHIEVPLAAANICSILCGGDDPATTPTNAASPGIPAGPLAK